MEWAHTDLENLRSIFLNKIYKLTPQLRKLSDIQQFVYLLQYHDVITTDIFGAWVDKCNTISLVPSIGPRAPTSFFFGTIFFRT